MSCIIPCITESAVTTCRCDRCDLVLQPQHEMRAMAVACPKVTPVVVDADPSSFTEQAIRYGQAIARWAAAGFPRRSRKEQEANLAICKPCQFYKDNRCTHQACGCQLESRLSGKSKIAMATEECPLKLWLATHGPLAPQPEVSDS